MRTVNENTTAILSLTFRDASKNLVTPTTCRYRVDDALTGQITDWASLAVSSPTVEIGITSAENSIINSVNPKEIKVVTVEATYPGGAEATTEYRYAVINLTYLGT